MQKANNISINSAYLKYRISPKFGKQKWIEFCETLLDKGFQLKLYEARQTVSKYITVNNGHGDTFKVRFSNHAPIKERELNDDCDFFVGKTHTGTRTTEMVIRRVLSFYADKMPRQVQYFTDEVSDFEVVTVNDNDEDLPW